MKQKLLIVLAFVLICITSKVQAYSFSAVAPSGQTLYYNIKTANTVEVTYQLAGYPYYNTKPIGALTIPDSVIYNGTTYSTSSIGNYAFEFCNGLTSIKIPNTITSIGFCAFYDCGGLTSITIPTFVTSIGDYAFNGCSGLTSIVTDTNNIKYSSIGGILFDKNFDTLYCYPAGKQGNYTIPNSVISIEKDAFYYCIGLTSITIPSSVTSIGEDAFAGCISLTSISIPNSVTSIGVGVFALCSGLTSITIPNSITSISSGAFQNCTQLTSITIPSSVTSIGEGAFYFCGGLASITCKALNPPSVQFYTFYGVNKTISVYVTCGSESTYKSASYWNAFTNLTEDDLTIHHDTICKGNIYNKFGFNFTADTSGVYLQSFQKNLGCDSIIKLNLIVNPIYNDNITSSICQGQTYNNYGFNFIADTTGVYTQNLQTINGCDSITLNLTVNPIHSKIYDDTICQGQVYNQYGFNADSSGIYFQNSQTINGCDSIIILNLTVNPTYSIIYNDSICQGQIYNQYGFNFVVDTAGYYTQNLQKINGCDSIIILNLTVNPIYNNAITASICKGEVYNQYGFNADSTSIYTQTMQTINGCDSIITLYLTVNQNYRDTIPTSICQGQVYNQYGFNADSTGFYTQNLQTINGCDSIITLNLTVNPIYSTAYNDTICQGKVYNQYGFNFIADTTGIYTQDLQTINGCDSIITLNLNVNPSPITPSGLLVERKHSYLEITWDSVGENYEVYRDDSLIATTSQAIYQDSNVVNDSSYCYKIKAFIGNCESDFSGAECMQFVGLNDININNQDITLYPNPTNGKAKLSIQSLNDKAQVNIFDLTGRVLKTYIIDTNQKELEIDLSGYAKGVYNISTNSNNTNISKKLIIQ